MGGGKGEKSGSGLEKKNWGIVPDEVEKEGGVRIVFCKDRKKKKEVRKGEKEERGGGYGEGNWERGNKREKLKTTQKKRGKRVWPRFRGENEKCRGRALLEKL